MRCAAAAGTACRPCRGARSEGVVEKNVQDSRRRIWLDAQNRRFGSFAELNAWLGERCRALWGELRHPEYKELSVAEMLEQERAQMMPMPAQFDGYVESSARVSGTCLINVQRNHYSVPCELAGKMVRRSSSGRRAGLKRCSLACSSSVSNAAAMKSHSG